MNGAMWCQLVKPGFSLGLALLCVAQGLSTTRWSVALSQRQEPTAPPTQPEKKPVNAEPTSGEEEAEAIEREMAQALHSLNQVAELAKEQPDPVVHIRSYAAIAEAIWPHDQPRARDLFRAALEETAMMPEPEITEATHWFGNPRSPGALRDEVLAKVTKLDPAFATKLAESIKPKREAKKESDTVSPDSEPPMTESERAQVLMSQAFSLFDQDPRKASELAAASLPEGITQLFVIFLTRLRPTDHQLADALFDRALQATLRNTPPRLYELILLGPYVQVNNPVGPFRSDENAPPVDPARLTRYLNVLVSALAVHLEAVLNPAAATKPVESNWLTTPDNLYVTLTAIQPYVAQYIPDQNSLVETLARQLSFKLSQQRYQRAEKLVAETAASPEERIDDLIGQANKTADPRERDALLFRAIHEAVRANQFEKALEILPKLRDVRLKTEVSDYIHYLRVDEAMKKNDLEAARQSAVALNNPERFTLAFIALARHLAGQNRTEAALATLSEAQIKVKQLPTSAGQARSWLRLADAFAPMDPDRAFDALTQMATALNQSNGDIEDASGANFGIDAYGFGLGQTIEPVNLRNLLEQLIRRLAKIDVTRASFMVTFLQPAPLRLLAQLALARAQLEQAEEKKAKLPRRTSGRHSFDQSSPDGVYCSRDYGQASS